MLKTQQFWCKISTAIIPALFWASLLIAFIGTNVNDKLLEEHMRMRVGFPTQFNWITSPIGKLKCYLFNVTNGEAFLNGTDKKIKVQEIGPITYRVKGKNIILKQTSSNLIFQKNHYDEVEFDPENSCSPDILNQTVVLPNLMILGAAAKLHDWVHFVKPAFNVITITEKMFVTETVNYFLWEFKTPALDLLSLYIPNIEPNCGMLYNALRKKEEVYNAKIATERTEDFFKLYSLNNKSYFPEQTERLRKTENHSIYCPIHINDAFDNSLFPPISPTTNLTIVAPEACRTHRLRYNGTLRHSGFNTYKFKMMDDPNIPNCLDNAMGIKLHRGFFDVSKCLFNDVPSAFSPPHFYDTSYNWSSHFEGFSPKQKKHEAYILFQPNTGIPVEEMYRFQSNIPMPDLRLYSKELQRFSNMVIPTFWYEYDLDVLPIMVLILLRVSAFGVLMIKPLVIYLLFLLNITSLWKVYILLKTKILFKTLNVC